MYAGGIPNDIHARSKPFLLGTHHLLLIVSKNGNVIAKTLIQPDVPSTDCKEKLTTGISVEQAVVRILLRSVDERVWLHKRFKGCISMRAHCQRGQPCENQTCYAYTFGSWKA